MNRQNQQNLSSVQPLRIALIRARYNPFGGAERFVTRALQALQGRDVALSVLARRWQGGEASAHAYWVKLDPFYLGSIWREWSFARAVHHYLADHPFDLVQSHERIPGVMLYRAGDGVHRVWLAERTRNYGRWQRFVMFCNPLHRFICKREAAMFKHPALRAVICNSQMVQQEIHQHFGLPLEKLPVIYNGVDLQQFLPPSIEHKLALRQQRKISQHAFYFLFVGSGYERKGLLQTLQAFAKLEQTIDGRTVQLLVIGHDKRQLRYQKIAKQLGIAGRVYFLGARHNLADWYALADCFVFPTLYDPFPNVVLEALASGLPVITSDRAGAAEILQVTEEQPTAAGWVVPAHDVAALQAQMQQVVTRNLTNHAKAARQLAEQFSLERMGDALQNLYRNLLK